MNARLSTINMSAMDWQMWTSDIEETLIDSLSKFAIYDHAIADALSRLSSHQAFFREHNPDLSAYEQEMQWMVVINTTAQELLENH